MPGTRSYPFRRVSVDNFVRGNSRIWWQLEPEFNAPGPLTYQLQTGRTGLRNAVDWIDVGLPAENAFYAIDSEQRDFGQTLETHYRIKLTTPTQVYVSPAVSAQGELDEQDWLKAREIIRKELVRHRRVSREGYLLKRLRYGNKCTRCRDTLTEETSDSRCPECNGTGFQIGYHAPTPFVCFDFSTYAITEDVDHEARGTVRDDAVLTARVIGFPMLSKADVFVDAKSDERWFIDSIKHEGLIRGIPVVSVISLRCAPFTDQIYKLEVGGEPTEREGPYLPGVGSGCVSVDHDYGGADELIVTTADGYAIVGATILVFTAAVYDAADGSPDSNLACASSSTMANGRWSYAVLLDPGDYVLVVEKVGEFAKVAHRLTVTGSSSSQAASSPSSASDFWSV